MRLFFMRGLIGLIAILITTACSTLNPGLPQSSQSQSAYGDFLAARYASAESDVAKAAEYFASAMRKDPENSELLQNAMLSAVYASDVKGAAKLAQTVLEETPENHIARLILATDFLARKKYAAVEALLLDAQLSPLNQIVGNVLLAWALEGQGRTDEALILIQKMQETPVLGELAAFQKGLILQHDGQMELAEQALLQALETRLLSERTAYALAGHYAQSAEPEALKTLIAARLELNPVEIEAKFIDQQMQKGSKWKQPFRTPRMGAAEGFYGPARALAEKSLHDLSVLYLEMAIHLDPNHGAARELLGRLYEMQQRPDDALAMYGAIKEQDPWYLQAQLDIAQALYRMERNAEGLEKYRLLAAKYDERNVQLALANALQVDQKFSESYEVYNQLISDAGGDVHWQLYFARAVSLERTGKWREAVPDFRKALEIDPNRAEVLNYLGYTFVDAGENLEEGFELIRQAIELEPKAGYIIDSLGWGHYRMGDYEQAVIELERAVAEEPGEPTINDHLGDAYWQVGRKLEARFQWQRVLSLEPDNDVDLDLITAKIKSGLQEGPETKLAGQ